MNHNFVLRTTLSLDQPWLWFAVITYRLNQFIRPKPRRLIYTTSISMIDSVLKAFAPRIVDPQRLGRRQQYLWQVSRPDHANGLGNLKLPGYEHIVPLNDTVTRTCTKPRMRNFISRAPWHKRKMDTSTTSCHRRNNNKVICTRP